MSHPPYRCRAVNPPQSQKSCPLSLFRRHLFGSLEPHSPPFLKIKKTVSGLTSCFKFMTLSWDWSCARQHICASPIVLTHASAFLRLYQSTRCWRDAPEFSCNLVVLIRLQVDARVGVDPRITPGLWGLQGGAAVAARGNTRDVVMVCATSFAGVLKNRSKRPDKIFFPHWI